METNERIWCYVRKQKCNLMKRFELVVKDDEERCFRKKEESLKGRERVEIAK